MLAAADAASLHSLWTQEVGQYGYSGPVRAGDDVYVATAFAGKLHRIDARTGEIRWTRELQATVHSDCGGDDAPGIWGSPALAGGAVYVGAPDGAVHALDAATGAELWQAPVAHPSPHAELIESPPTLAAGRLLVGVAATAHCDPAQGRVAAVDLASHAVIQQPVVGPGQVGGGVWSGLSVDEPSGVAYAATGNPVGPASAEPLAQAVVALDLATLGPRDHWQNPAALANCDFGGSPTLVDAGGRRLLAVTSKDGWLYVLDRDLLSAGPVWRYQLAVLDPDRPGECGDPLAGFGTIVSPAYGNGLLYVGGGRTPDGHPGSLVALEPDTGRVRFTHFTPGFVIAAPAVAGELVVVASSSTADAGSTLEVLDARSGALLRTFSQPSATFSAPVVSHGVVLWLTFDGHLTALGR